MSWLKKAEGYRCAYARRERPRREDEAQTRVFYFLESRFRSLPTAAIGLIVLPQEYLTPLILAALCRFCSRSIIPAGRAQSTPALKPNPGRFVALRVAFRAIFPPACRAPTAQRAGRELAEGMPRR